MRRGAVAHLHTALLEHPQRAGDVQGVQIDGRIADADRGAVFDAEPDAGGQDVGEHLGRFDVHGFGGDTQGEPVPQRFSRLGGHADALEPLFGAQVGEVGRLAQRLPAQQHGGPGRP